MRKISEISHKVILLLVDILLLLVDIVFFTWQTIRALILPARRRKGNVLSSLLSFFVGLLEKFISFEKSILRRPVLFKHRYVKQVLVLAAGFLFLLSSIEWTVGPAAEWTAAEPAVVAGESPGVPITILAEKQAMAPVANTGEVIFTPGYSFYKSPPPASGGPATVKRCIRYCVFRI